MLRCHKFLTEADFFAHDNVTLPCLLTHQSCKQVRDENRDSSAVEKVTQSIIFNAAITARIAQCGRPWHPPAPKTTGHRI
jgi:hypothetical protein